MAIWNPRIDPLLTSNLRREEPIVWINEHWRSTLVPQAENRFGIRNVLAAERRLLFHAPALAKLFPELRPTSGVIESELLPAPELQRAMAFDETLGRWFIKADHALPVAGSVKARGGIYAVLALAENIALSSGQFSEEQGAVALTQPKMRAHFHRHTVSVASTGNLGLSVGIVAAALGFRVIVHVSRDAKQWKKERLRAVGALVVEHEADFTTAVAAGRNSALDDPLCHFVDDEFSEDLFFGYSVAAIRIKRQLVDLGVKVDAAHPLFVYLPCGVGGAPGGITFGLRHLFGDNVHCFFAEPVTAPCMLVRLASDPASDTSVESVGLRVATEADGLAVGSASQFAAPLIAPLVSGIFTVTDQTMLRGVYLAKQASSMKIEPSASAAFTGPMVVTQSREGRAYLEAHGLSHKLARASHIVWTTGGSLMPEPEYQKCWERGRQLDAKL